MKEHRIGLIVGSLRRDSVNKRLAASLRKMAPVDFHFVDIPIGNLPLYNQDDEAPELPGSVAELKRTLDSVNAVLFVTPEYNRSIPGVLKNAIDWASRPKGKNSLAGKPGAVCGAALGAIGTAVAQQHLRSMLAALGVHTMGQPEFYLHFTPNLIDEEGNVVVESTAAFVRSFVNAYAEWVRRLND